MRKKYILALLLFFCLVISTYFISNNNDEVQIVKDVFMVSELKSNCTIEQIVEESEKYMIKVYYPVTDYPDLNNEIKTKVESYISNFKKDIDSLPAMESEQKYRLEVMFFNYECQDYISFVFHSFIDTGGAHPNTQVWTISYDIKEEKIVTMKDLVGKNKEILNILSDYTYAKLKDDQRIQMNYQEEMLKSGTKPIVENFSNFAFDKKELKIFFEKYSVAPYVAGEFVVDVPYDKIDIGI